MNGVAGRFSGKVAVVTGASRGIGRAIALRLARGGASLALLARSAEHLQEVAAQIGAEGGQSLSIPCDVSRRSEVEAATAAILSRWDTVHFLINNAGVVVRQPLLELTEESWDEVLNINLKGPYLCTRALLPTMLACGDGRIVNICSISSTLGTARMTSYCAAKWGLLGFTKALAEELRGSGVAVTAVLPGSTDTEMLKGSGFAPEWTPDQVAQVVAFLLAKAPPAMTGTAIELFA